MCYLCIVIGLLFLFGIFDQIAFYRALRWRFSRQIPMSEWESNRYRYLPGGGFYMLEKYRLR
jgi:hypothetical protein